MTVEKILISADAQTPNVLGEEVKIGWICDVEGRILTEIYKKDAANITLPTSGDHNLTLPETYSRVYLLYLSAMIEFSKGNYEAFSEINREFEKAFSAYAAYFIKNR